MKVCLLMPRGDYESTPCVKSLAEEIAAGGVEVDVFTIKNKAFPIPEVGQNQKGIKILYCPFIKQDAFWEDVSLVTSVFSVWVYYRILTSRYKYIIACGIRALFIAGFYNLFTRKKIIYNSLELYIAREITKPTRKIFKKLEGFFNRRVERSITQDEQRASILAYENKIDIDSILLFPNSTRGPSQEKSKEAKDKLIEKYSLPEDSRIILYAGSFFETWALIEPLLKSFETWPKNWFLMLHSRMNSSDVDDACERLSLSDSRNMLLSNDSLTNRDYEYLVQGCDVGVALYNGDESDNIKYVGLSSGKIAQYLKYGLPIIVNDLPVWDEIIPKYNCGGVITTGEDITRALNSIFANYEISQKGAFSVFDELFTLKKFTPSILDALNS